MAQALEILSTLFNQEKCSYVHDSALVLTEKHREATLKKIKIISVGQNAFSLKLDECSFPGNSAFSAQHPMHRACDAVAFCVVGGEPYVLCCELKSSEPARHEATKQFQSAHCFLEYIDSLLRMYHGESIAHWPRRYFVFHDSAKTPLSKSPLIESPDNDRPERAQILSVQNGTGLYLRKLLGKPL